MSKQDEALAQIESIVRELNRGKEETAATAAIGETFRSRHLSEALFTRWGVKIVIGVLFFFIVAIGIWQFTNLRVEGPLF